MHFPAFPLRSVFAQTFLWPSLYLYAMQPGYIKEIKMPNWVTNSITVDEKNFDRLCDLLLNDDELVDFNQVIPMPEDCYQGNLSIEDKIKYPLNWYDSEERPGKKVHA